MAASMGKWVPQHGDIAYYEDHVPGGDPYRVTVVWRHRDPAPGWFNVAGTMQPVDVTGKRLHLLVRNGRSVDAAQARTDGARAVFDAVDEAQRGQGPYPYSPVAAAGAVIEDAAAVRSLRDEGDTAAPAVPVNDFGEDANGDYPPQPDDGDTAAGGERECCGEPMTRYPQVAWECSAALNALQEAEAVDNIGATPPILNDDAPDWARTLHRHLLQSRIPWPDDEAAPPPAGGQTDAYRLPDGRVVFVDNADRTRLLPSGKPASLREDTDAATPLVLVPAAGQGHERADREALIGALVSAVYWAVGTHAVRSEAELRGRIKTALDTHAPTASDGGQDPR